MERTRLHHPEGRIDELDDRNARFEDLTAYYPAAAQASPNGRGAPAAPAAAATGPATVAGAPAIWVLAIVAASLILLHQAG